MIIKPHHFVDILKLYGAGIECFVPDEKMGHDFYKVANEIINNHQTTLTLTIDGDDICQPCVCFSQGQCQDCLPDQVTSKNTYNHMLDKRMMALYHLSFHHTYTSEELATIINDDIDNIFRVWLEEENALTQKRVQLLSIGLKKYLNK